DASRRRLAEFQLRRRRFSTAGVVSAGGVQMVFLIIVVAIVGMAIFAYNRLVSLRNQVDNSWRQIDVQLKRRHELIPNLVEAVKGYMKFERATLTQVVGARA